MNYLYIFNNGDMKQVSNEELTNEDMNSIEGEILTLVRFQGNQYEVASVESEEIESDDPEEGPEYVYTIAWKPV